MGCASTPTSKPRSEGSPSGRGPELSGFEGLTGFCDGIEPLTKAEHATHVAKVQANLAAEGLAALIVEPGPTMFYLSGVRWGLSERPFLMVVPVEGAPWWICPRFEADRAKERAGAEAELRLWHEHEDPYAFLAKGLPSGAVAVDPAIRHFVFDGISSARPAGTVRSGRGVVEAARMIKSPRELALMRRANEATKAALGQVVESTRIGMRESEVRRIVHATQTAAGLTNVWSLVLFGPNAAFPHGTGKERTLAEGDFILIDTGGKLHGYSSDITRTWAVGRVPDESRRIFDVVLAAQEAAFAQLRPGVPCQQIDAAARAVIRKAGFGADYEAFTHRLGHGIGLQGHESPYLVRGNERILQPGMTMSNEPGIYLGGRLGVRIEDILAITEGGFEAFGSRVSGLDPASGRYLTT